MSKIKSDGRRGFYAQKQAFNPEHPYSQFAVGSLDTLAETYDVIVPALTCLPFLPGSLDR